MNSQISSLPPGIEPPVRLRGGARIRHAAWSPPGDSLAAALEDGGVRLWIGLPDRFRSMKDVPAPRDVQALDTPVSQVAWTPAGTGIAAVSAAGRRIAVWDVENGARRCVIDVDAGELLCAAWAGEERLNVAVVSGARPHQRLAIRGYDAASGGLMDECLDEPREKAATGGSADGRLLAVAGAENAVQVWDLARASVVATVQARPERLHGVALAPGGRSLVLSANEGEIQVYDVRTGQLREVLYEHSRRAHSVVFSDDGRLLASRSADDTVRLWRCDTWECVATLEETSHDPVELSFRPHALTLTSYDGNNTALRIWEIDYPEIIRGPMINILMLTSDPFDAARLRLDEEKREIREQLRLSGLRSRFAFEVRDSVRPRDFSLGLLEARPRIVHFSGHGGSDGSIWLEDEIGNSHPVAPEVLGGLMEQMSEHVECVILNACYSRQQADAISRSIDYVIGTEGRVEDRAAIAFSVGFYQALGAGRSVEEAFAWGRNQMALQCGGESAVPPVLKKKNGG